MIIILVITVIPAPKAYTKIAVVKTLVVDKRYY